MTRTIEWRNFSELFEDCNELVSSGILASWRPVTSYIYKDNPLQHPSLIIGVPRAGLLAALYVSEQTGIPAISLDDFLDGRSGYHGGRRVKYRTDLSEKRWILILDDSFSDGNTYKMIRSRIATSPTATALTIENKIQYGVIYGSSKAIDNDVHVFREVKTPRMFEWSIQGRRELASTLLDIDGLLYPIVTGNFHK